MTTYEEEQKFANIRIVKVVAMDRGIYLTQDQGAMHFAIIFESLEEQLANGDIESIDDEFYQEAKNYFNN